jgi:hypothetical protein
MAVGILLVLPACETASDTTVVDLSSAEYVIRDGSGPWRPASLAEIEEAAPFDVVLPSRSPSDLRLEQVALLPPAGQAGSIEGRARNTILQMSFVMGDRAVIFSQSIAGDGPRDLAEPLELDSGPAELALEEGHGYLSWRACDLGFSVAYTPESIELEELTAFANAVNEGCAAR